MILRFKIGECRTDDTIRGTGLIIFPTELMNKYYLLAGMRVLLRLPDRKEIVCIVGIPYKDETIRLDKEYEFIYDYSIDDDIEVIKVDEILLETEDTILLKEKGSSIGDINKWIEKTKIINSNSLYNTKSGKVVFLQGSEGFKIKRPVAISPKAIQRIYSINTDIEQWKDKWEEYRNTLKDAKEAEQEFRKDLLTLQKLKRDMRSRKDEISNQLEKLKLLQEVINGLSTLEILLSNELLEKLDSIKNDYKGLESQRGSETNASIDKIKELFIFKDFDCHLPDLEVITDIADLIDETENHLPEIDSTLENIESILKEEKQFSRSSTFIKEIDLEEETENLQTRVQSFKEKLDSLRSSKEEINNSFLNLIELKKRIIGVIETHEEENKIKNTEIKEKFEKLSDIADYLPPARDIIKSLRDKYNSLENERDAEKLKESIMEMGKLLSFLNDSAEKVKQLLMKRERKRVIL